MIRSTWRRRAAAAIAVAMLAAACGGEDDPADDETTTDAEATETGTEEATASEDPLADVEVTGAGDGTLTIGTVLPESGQLAFLGSPQIEAVGLAIEDINAAGGVLGSDVELIQGDSGTDPAVARQTTATALSQGADAIIGAAASGISQEIIQTLFDNEVAQCSASNTSPSFTDQENNGFYFRTVPPDEAVAPIIANAVINDNYSNVAIVARADDYGNALAGLVEESLTNAGASIAATVSYNPDTTSFDAEVSEVGASGADSVVVIGFAEAATLIRQAAEAGVPTEAMYGGDGLFGPTLPGDAGIDIPGFKVIGAAGGEEFNNRLNELVDTPGNLIYGGQAYDCAIVIALAAEVAGSDDPSVFMAEVSGVTMEGTECASFEECKGLIESGEDIDYNGAAGPLEVTAPDPAFGRYAIAEFQDDGSLEIVGSEDVDLSTIE